MEIKEFIEKLADAIEREEEIKPEDAFLDYEEWSSLTYLSVIAMMDEEFGVQIEGSDFKKLITVQDLYNACINR